VNYSLAVNSPDSDRARFTELLRAGHVAAAAGKRRRAHYLWRRAAVLCPYEEQIWLALLSVLENEEDRRVCLQNILAINPGNRQAFEQLKALSPAEQTQPVKVQLLSSPLRPLWRSLLFRVVLYTLSFLLLLVITALMGVLLKLF